MYMCVGGWVDECVCVLEFMCIQLEFGKISDL